MCTCMCRTLGHTWKPEVDIKTSFASPTNSFETRLLTGPGAHRFSEINWAVRPRELPVFAPCLSLPSAGVTGLHIHTQPFRWVLALKHRSLSRCLPTDTSPAFPFPKKMEEAHVWYLKVSQHGHYLILGFGIAPALSGATLQSPSASSALPFLQVQGHTPPHTLQTLTGLRVQVQSTKEQPST